MVRCVMMVLVLCLCAFSLGCPKPQAVDMMPEDVKTTEVSAPSQTLKASTQETGA